MHDASKPTKVLLPLMIIARRAGQILSRWQTDACRARTAPTATGWWKDCQLHRDPKDGPALYRKGPQREYVEYCVDGETHRDHRDGPAIIEIRLDGDGGRLEEFWEHGKRHRPASEGPAVRDTDRDGNCLVEFYADGGKCHRDPAQGPAWAGWKTAGTLRPTW